MSFKYMEEYCKKHNKTKLLNKVAQILLRWDFDAECEAYPEITVEEAEEIINAVKMERFL